MPRILRAGAAYQVGAALVEPSTGRVVEEAQRRPRAASRSS